MSLTIADLETPIPLVDLDRLARNLDRAAEYAKTHDLALRPHVKTHKSPHVAKMQLERGAAGLTCATTYEAEVMSEVCDDILVMYPPVGEQRAMRLAQIDKKVKLTVSLDSVRALGEIAHAAHIVDRPIGVYIELDLGMRRVGTSRFDVALELAQLISQRPPLTFEGISFYPGHIRDSVDQQGQKLRELSGALSEMLDKFAQAGMSPRVVSAGSTPTLWHSHEIRGVTEIRPGTYVYNDRTTAEIGACAWEDCALTVLATVVSTSVYGQAVIDAGSKALGREPIRGVEGEGFGCLINDRDVTVKSMSEEHGILELKRTLWRPQVGDRVRIIPNHVCIVTHLNDVVAGVRGDRVETSWPITARGRGYRIAQ
jgi:D-serine deaminase-like pyridoxal phosphate-dependent protein